MANTQGLPLLRLLIDDIIIDGQITRSRDSQQRRKARLLAIDPHCRGLARPFRWPLIRGFNDAAQHLGGEAPAPDRAGDQLGEDEVALAQCKAEDEESGDWRLGLSCAFSRLRVGLC